LTGEFYKDCREPREIKQIKQITEIEEEAYKKTTFLRIE
jgi:hypothetical protein